MGVFLCVLLLLCAAQQVLSEDLLPCHDGGSVDTECLVANTTLTFKFKRTLLQGNGTLRLQNATVERLSNCPQSNGAKRDTPWLATAYEEQPLTYDDCMLDLTFDSIILEKGSEILAPSIRIRAETLLEIDASSSVSASGRGSRDPAANGGDGANGLGGSHIGLGSAGCQHEHEQARAARDFFPFDGEVWWKSGGSTSVLSGRGGGRIAIDAKREFRLFGHVRADGVPGTGVLPGRCAAGGGGSVYVRADTLYVKAGETTRARVSADGGDGLTATDQTVSTDRLIDLTEQTVDQTDQTVDQTVEENCSGGAGGGGVAWLQFVQLVDETGQRDLNRDEEFFKEADGLLVTAHGGRIREDDGSHVCYGGGTGLVRADHFEEIDGMHDSFRADVGAAEKALPLESRWFMLVREDVAQSAASFLVPVHVNQSRATLFSAQRAVLVPARLIVSETRVSEGTRASGTRASGTRASDSWTLVAAQEISLTQCNVLRISDTASGRIPMELPPALSSQRSRLRLRGDRVHVAQSDVTLAEADWHAHSLVFDENSDALSVLRVPSNAQVALASNSTLEIRGDIVTTTDTTQAPSDFATPGFLHLRSDNNVAIMMLSTVTVPALYVDAGADASIRGTVRTSLRKTVDTQCQSDASLDEARIEPVANCTFCVFAGGNVNIMSPQLRASAFTMMAPNGNVTIDIPGRLTASEMGCVTAQAPGLGAGGHNTSVGGAGAGAGFGGPGGDAHDGRVRGGQSYGSGDDARFFGSLGGGGGDTGGAGGGHVTLVAGQTLRIDGKVRVDGGPGSSQGFFGGGGSGGSIVLAAQHLIGRAGASVSAVGGSDGKMASPFGGGAGGRFLVHWLDSTRLSDRGYSVRADDLRRVPEGWPQPSVRWPLPPVDKSPSLRGRGDAFFGVVSVVGGKGGHTADARGENGADGSVLSSPTCAPGSGGALCRSCSAGSVKAGPGNEVCEPCQPGQAQSLRGQAECVVCEKGFFAGDPGSTECAVCDDGWVSPAGAAQCRVCPSGTFSRQPESRDRCSLCPADTFSGEGSAECTPCDAGWWSLPRSAECSKCENIPEHSVFTEPSGCAFRCLAGYVGDNCLTPWQNLVNLVGGPISLAVIAAFTLVALALPFLCCLIINSRRRQHKLLEDLALEAHGEAQHHTIDAFDDFESLQQYRKDYLRLHGVDPVLLPSLSGHRRLGSSGTPQPTVPARALGGHSDLVFRVDQFAYHLRRLYLEGTNNPEAPWRLSETIAPKCRRVLLRAEYAALARKLTSLAQFSSRQLRVLSFLRVVSPPLARVYLERQRRLVVARIAKYLQQYDHACFRSYRARARCDSLKFGVSSCCTTAWLDVLVDVSTDLGQEDVIRDIDTQDYWQEEHPAAQVGLPRAPEVLVASGAGTFFEPFHLEMSDALCRSMARYFGSNWYLFVMALNARLRAVPWYAVGDAENRALCELQHFLACMRGAGIGIGKDMPLHGLRLSLGVVYAPFGRQEQDGPNGQGLDGHGRDMLDTSLEAALLQRWSSAPGKERPSKSTKSGNVARLALLIEPSARVAYDRAAFLQSRACVPLTDRTVTDGIIDGATDTDTHDSTGINDGAEINDRYADQIRGLDIDHRGVWQRLLGLLSHALLRLSRVHAHSAYATTRSSSCSVWHCGSYTGACIRAALFLLSLVDAVLLLASLAVLAVASGDGLAGGVGLLLYALFLPFASVIAPFLGLSTAVSASAWTSRQFALWNALSMLNVIAGAAGARLVTTLPGVLMTSLPLLTKALLALVVGAFVAQQDHQEDRDAARREQQLHQHDGAANNKADDDDLSAGTTSDSEVLVFEPHDDDATDEEKEATVAAALATNALATLATVGTNGGPSLGPSGLVSPPSSGHGRRLQHHSVSREFDDKRDGGSGYVGDWDGFYDDNAHLY